MTDLGGAAVNVIVSARDNRGGLISDSIVLTVAASDNDAPINSVPATQTTLQNRAINLSGANGFSIFDADAGNNPLKTTLNATSGILTVEFVPNGLNVSGNGTNNVVLTGSVSNINLALSSLRYMPAQTFSGAATITVTTDDQGNSGPAQIDTDSFVINVVADNDFDGVNDSINFPVPASVTGSSARTVEFWYKVAANQAYANK